MQELAKLFKGAGFDTLGSNTLESVELRLERIASKADKGMCLCFSFYII